jgi:periplasmic divalent cation tolerance protein
MTDKIIVTTTCGNAEEANRIARSLVEKRLAACVQMMPGMRSVYRWQGKVEEAGEIALWIKTSRPLLARVQAEVARLHSYSTPELMVTPIVDGSPAYLLWMEGELAQ